MTQKESPSRTSITKVLALMRTKTAGPITNVYKGSNDTDLQLWVATPKNRERLDHYVGTFDYRDVEDDLYDPEGWNEEAWVEEYADPLKREVIQELHQIFPDEIFDVEIGEKGHIEVSRIVSRVVE